MKNRKKQIVCIVFVIVLAIIVNVYTTFPVLAYGSASYKKTVDSVDIKSDFYNNFIVKNDNTEKSNIREILKSKINENVEINEQTFPDLEFRNYIISSFDRNKDGILSTEEISQVEVIYITNNQQLTNLQGIENFTNLKFLYCNNTGIEILDLNQNTALVSLDCSNTGIKSLDINRNTKLTSLKCDNTKIKNLDVSQNIALIELRCSNTEITSLDLSQNAALTGLFCANTAIKNLDISKNKALEILYCNNTEISNLDVSQNLNLMRLICFDTQITDLDISQNVALAHLECYNTGITSLDFTNQQILKYLYCWNTPMVWMNLGNKPAEIIASNSELNIGKVRDTFNIREKIPNIDISKITNIYGATLDKNTGVVSGYKEGEPIVYTYDCGAVDHAYVFNNLNGSETFDEIRKILDSESNYQQDSISLNITLNFELINDNLIPNELPSISGEDKLLTVGDTFDPLNGITASDKEDGNITQDIKAIYNDVDTSKIGKYKVIYKVSDSQGAFVTKTIVVIVKENDNLILNELPSISGEDKLLTVGDTFDPLDGITASDKEDGNITQDIKVIYNDVDTSKIGKYKVIYKVSDSQGAFVTKTIAVTVKENLTIKDEESIEKSDETDKKVVNKDNVQLTSIPKTNDDSNVELWISILLILIVAGILGKDREKKIFKR